MSAPREYDQRFRDRAVRMHRDALAENARPRKAAVRASIPASWRA